MEYLVAPSSLKYTNIGQYVTITYFNAVVKQTLYQQHFQKLLAVAIDLVF